MMGLVLKDFLCMRRVLKSMLLVAAFYMVLAFTDMFDLSMMAGIIMILLSFQPANCFSYDAAYGWDVYAGTLPLSRAQQVCARYLTVLLLITLGWVFSLAVAGAGALFGLMDNWDVFLAADAAYAFMALFCNAIMIPLLYKFGAERARVLSYSVLAGMVLAGFLAFKLLGGTEALNSLEESPAYVILPFLAALLLFALSVPISLNIYQKKDF